MASDDVPMTPHPFDVETIRQLIRLMARHDLNEIDLTDGDSRIRLRRGLAGARTMVATAPGPISASPPAPVAPAEAAVPPPPVAPARNLIEIKSPTPGTFYLKPNPDADDFVKVGSRVQPETVVCLVEAMKTFNEIKAECSGVIVEVVAEAGGFVEYGTVLFRVDPTG